MTPRQKITVTCHHDLVLVCSKCGRDLNYVNIDHEEVYLDPCNCVIEEARRDLGAMRDELRKKANILDQLIKVAEEK